MNKLYDILPQAFVDPTERAEGTSTKGLLRNEKSDFFYGPLRASAQIC